MAQRGVVLRLAWLRHGVRQVPGLARRLGAVLGGPAGVFDGFCDDPGVVGAVARVVWPGFDDGGYPAGPVEDEQVEVGEIVKPWPRSGEVVFLSVCVACGGAGAVG